MCPTLFFFKLLAKWQNVNPLELMEMSQMAKCKHIGIKGNEPNGKMNGEQAIWQNVNSLE